MPPCTTTRSSCSSAASFAIVFPLVLDAVISVLAVTVLLERALRRRTVTIKGWEFTLRLPTWPLLALWAYFGGSVAGNVAHAPNILAAQMVAAVPPISAGLTFHLLLRLLDRAPRLRAIAETYEERIVDEQERAARRRARRTQLKDSRTAPLRAASAGGSSPQVVDDGRRDRVPDTDRTFPGAENGDAPASGSGSDRRQPNGQSAEDLEQLRRRVQEAVDAGERVTGETVARWLGVSARTGRRRLATALQDTLQ